MDILSGFLSTIRPLISLNKGLACFDPNLFFRDDSKTAVDCFIHLFTEFRQRGWFTPAERSPAVTEYTSFVTELRGHHVDTNGRPLPVVNIISLLAGHELLVDKPLVRKIFELGCLCLPLKGPVPPTPSLGLAAEDLTSDQARSLVQPLFSFFAQVEPDFTFTFDGDSLAECKEVLDLDCSLYSSDSYNPWEHVGRGDQEEIYTRLLAQYKLARGSRTKGRGYSAPTSLVGVVSAPPVAPSGPCGSVTRASLRGLNFNKKKSPQKK